MGIVVLGAVFVDIKGYPEAAVAAKREKELAQTFANLERIWDEYDVYEKQAER